MKVLIEYVKIIYVKFNFVFSTDSYILNIVLVNLSFFFIKRVLTYLYKKIEFYNLLHENYRFFQCNKF